MAHYTELLRRYLKIFVLIFNAFSMNIRDCSILRITNPTSRLRRDFRNVQNIIDFRIIQNITDLRSVQNITNFRSV